MVVVRALVKRNRIKRGREREREKERERGREREREFVLCEHVYLCECISAQSFFRFNLDSGFCLWLCVYGRVWICVHVCE